jgi:hypothetical protein
MFKVGDFVKGTNRKSDSKFSHTNTNLLKARVVEVNEFNSMMIIEIEECKIPSAVGQRYRVSQRYFDKYDNPLIKGVEVVSTKNRPVEIDEAKDKNIITISNEIFISIPSGSSFGISSKHDNDEFNEEIGKSLAYFRFIKNKEM